MELSLFLAQLFGVYFVIQGLFVFLRRDKIESYVRSFFESKNEALLLVTGIITIIMGLILVLLHNVWEGTYEVLITVIAWIVLIKGALYLFFPDGMQKIGKNILKNKSLITVAAVAALIIGLYLVNIGFGLGIV